MICGGTKELNGGNIKIGERAVDKRLMKEERAYYSLQSLSSSSPKAGQQSLTLN